MQQKSSNSIRVFGFSLLRNGVKYDYSFKESLLSMKTIVEQVYLALDKGEDSSFDEISKLEFVKIVPTIWDMSLTKGHVLSVETNKALSALREHHCEENQWGIYLQADEVLHEDDYELLKSDIAKANDEGFDAISFRYLHFWQTHHHLAIAKNWYPEEIRAIKLNSNIESYGDAQSFKGQVKVYQSEARIFHYGHVRDQSIYKSKMEDMSKLYDQDAKKSKYYNEKDRNKEYTDCVLYYGSHPLVMKDRIKRLGDIFELDFVQEVYIVGDPNNYSSHVLDRVKSRKILWLSSLKSVPAEYKDQAVILNPTLLQKLFYPSNVPTKMKSKAARDWSNDFYFILKLSEKNIGTK